VKFFEFPQARNKRSGFWRLVGAKGFEATTQSHEILKKVLSFGIPVEPFFARGFIRESKIRMQFYEQD
jgi:hypothetical protein